MRPFRKPAALLAALSGLAAVTMAFSPAHASWEKIGIAEDAACASPLAGGNFFSSKSRPLRIRPGTTKNIEVYGHGLDLSRTASMSGITGGSASAFGGRGGAENAARGCGGIGSMRLQIRVAENADPGDKGTLIVGDQRIPVEIVDTGLQTSWSVYNNSDALSDETQAEIERRRAQNFSDAQAAASSQQRIADCANGVTQCEANRARRRAQIEIELANCAASGNCIRSSVNTFSQSCQQAVQACRAPTRPRPNPQLEGPARCLRDLGGFAEVDTNGVLQLFVPMAARENTAALRTCLARDLPVEFETVASGADITPATGLPFGQGVTTPFYQKTAATGTYPMGDATPFDERFPAVLYGRLSATRIVDEVAGVTEGTITFGVNSIDSRSGGYSKDNFRDAAPLKWRLETLPQNGVASLAPQIVAGKRLASQPVTVNVTLRQPTAASTASASKTTTSLRTSMSKAAPTPTARWEIVAAGTKSASACFSRTSGDIVISTGSKSGTFQITPTEASGCSTAQFTVKAAPDGVSTAAGAPFAAEKTFSLGSPLSLATTGKTTLPRPIKIN
ncbi:hypothetical protein FF098_003865 [Parvularcula flava]|uniref:Uncharacterized protein n=1 Tax=Aquisalinus luteolus TaxID=1566827 RepID=A0A8J3A2K6_9PROT|nr:hypothetical protein [Aquisalinus luteolus]NHK27040.1 hypothetical protein [Aquisalinus luteolus]GGH94181.1 hypothetical protein GCM10011355_07760 [Aquisalinus luteolus]